VFSPKADNLVLRTGEEWVTPSFPEGPVSFEECDPPLGVPLRARGKAPPPTLSVEKLAFWSGSQDPRVSVHMPCVIAWPKALATGPLGTLEAMTQVVYSQTATCVAGSNDGGGNDGDYRSAGSRTVDTPPDRRLVPLSHLFPRPGLDPVVAVLRDLVKEIRAMMALMAPAVRHLAVRVAPGRTSLRPSPTPSDYPRLEEARISLSLPSLPSTPFWAGVTKSRPTSLANPARVRKGSDGSFRSVTATSCSRTFATPVVF
jgi:hypothetical protein